MFAIFNWALVVFAWFFIKETKGKSLEEMEERECYSFWSEKEAAADSDNLVFGGNALPHRDPEALKAIREDGQLGGQQDGQNVETVIPDKKDG